MDCNRIVPFSGGYERVFIYYGDNRKSQVHQELSDLSKRDAGLAIRFLALAQKLELYTGDPDIHFSQYGLVPFKDEHCNLEIKITKKGSSAMRILGVGRLEGNYKAYVLCHMLKVHTGKGDKKLQVALKNNRAAFIESAEFLENRLEKYNG